MRLSDLEAARLASTLYGAGAALITVGWTRTGVALFAAGVPLDIWRWWAWSLHRARQRHVDAIK